MTTIYLGAFSIMQPASAPSQLPSLPVDGSSLWTLPVILSTISILVSVSTAAFTAYNQYWKRPSIRVYLAPRFEVWIGHHDEAVITAYLTLFNNGALYAAVNQLRAELRRRGDSQAYSLEWRMFIEHANVGKERSSSRTGDSRGGLERSSFLAVRHSRGSSNLLVTRRSTSHLESTR
jgi:hypothetical protein